MFGIIIIFLFYFILLQFPIRWNQFQDRIIKNFTIVRKIYIFYFCVCFKVCFTRYGCVGWSHGFNGNIENPFCNCLYSHEKWAIHLPWLMFQFFSFFHVFSTLIVNIHKYITLNFMRKKYLVFCSIPGVIWLFFGVSFFFLVDFHTQTTQEKHKNNFHFISYWHSFGHELCVQSHFNA